jgi:hypothetical protein
VDKREGERRKRAEQTVAQKERVRRYEHEWYAHQQQTARRIREELRDDRAVTIEPSSSPSPEGGTTETAGVTGIAYPKAGR